MLVRKQTGMLRHDVMQAFRHIGSAESCVTCCVLILSKVEIENASAVQAASVEALLSVWF